MLKYSTFLARLLREYEPFSYEIDQHNALYNIGKDQNWAVRQSRRFHHIYSTCFPYVCDGSVIIDLGAYPGSYLKILRLIYGDKVSLIAAGMPVQPSFPRDMRDLDVPFIPCDLDTVALTNYPRTLSLQANSVDVVICTEMIEHLYSVKLLMSEIQRVLKPGGVAYISTNNVAYIPGLFNLLRGETNLDVDLHQTSALAETEWRGHVRFYSLAQLERLASQFGLALVQSGYHQMRVPRVVVSRAALARWWLSRVLDAAVAPVPRFRSHIYVLCRKPQG